MLLRKIPPWFGMSLKLRLNLMITALLSLLLLVGTVVLINNAREQVLAEVESTASLATHLLDAETIYYSSVMQGEPLHQPFRLQGLEHLRHLRIEVRDVGGRVIDSNQARRHVSEDDQPPAWFVRAMTVALPHPVEVRRPLSVNGRTIGDLTVTPDPSYEVAEIWRDSVDLFMLVLVFFISVNLMVYWAVGHALRPVDRILKALNDLESGNLAARLPVFELPDLARISHKFNGMAQHLQQSIGRNHKLAQQLIHLQEEERKSLARDLHDELGQYLTAIRTDAATLLEMSRSRYPDARESAQAIVDVTLQVMAVIGAMLQRLRPEVLDVLGLQPALIELITTWRQRNRIGACIVRIPDDLPRFDESTSITAYRVVQECLTNVARHAGARRVEIDIKMLRHISGQVLEVSVNDDGVGFDPANVEGFGLNGMRERVEGLGGEHEIVSGPGTGTRVIVRLPVACMEGA